MANAAVTSIVNLGSVDAIPLGQGRCYVVGNQEIAVFRQRDGSLFAIQNRCPHRQGPLAEGLVGAGRVLCPLHGHQFDLRTGSGSEAAECVEAFSAQVVAGSIVLNL